MIYQIEITGPAVNDIENIGIYISQELHSQQAAYELIAEIDEQISNLEKMPKRYAPVNDERLAYQGIRKVNVKKYLIFFIINEQSRKVTIIRVLYAARDWVNLL